jgi:hypothetical protein
MGKAVLQVAQLKQKRREGQKGKREPKVQRQVCTPPDPKDVG